MIKKILILSITAFLVFGFASLGSANLVQSMPQAEYYVVNSNSPTPNDISISYYDNNLILGTLEYSINNGQSWTALPSNIVSDGTFSVGSVYDKQLVMFRIQKPDNSFITQVTLTFLAESGTGSNLFRSVAMNFGGNQYFSFNTAADPHYLSPVPIPGSLPLLISGLVGLAGLRRRLKN